MLTGNQGLDDIDDLLLLMARQFADDLKNAPGFARRAGAALFGGVDAQQVIGADTESDRQSSELFRPERYGLAFPPTQGALSNAKPVGQIALVQTGFFACRDKTFAESRSLPIGGSSHIDWHGRIINRIYRNIRKCLHGYTQYKKVVGMSKSSKTGLTPFGENNAAHP